LPLSYYIFAFPNQIAVILIFFSLSTIVSPKEEN